MCLVFKSDLAQANAFSSYIYGAKKQRLNCDVNASVGHFQCMEVPKLVASPPANRVEVVKRAQVGTIVQLNHEQQHGFIRVDGERLFFHASQLTGCAMHELACHDKLRFDVVFNPRTGKFLAKNVKLEAQRENSQVGHFIDMQVPATASPASHKIEIQESATGKVTEIHADYGLIDNEIFFHYTQLVGTHTSEISVGDKLDFAVTFNKKSNRKVAEQVKKAFISPASNLGHFIDMRVPVLTQSAPVATQKIELEASASGKVTSVHADYGFIDEEIFFHYTQLVGTHMSELAVGDKLEFTVTFNKKSNRKVAEHVKKATIATAPSKELVAVRALLKLEGANMLRRLSQNMAVINIVEDMEVDDAPQVCAMPKEKDALSTASLFVNLSNANSRRNSRRGSTCSLIRM